MEIYYWIERFDKGNQANDMKRKKKKTSKGDESEFNMPFDFSHLFEVPPLLLYSIVLHCICLCTFSVACLCQCNKQQLCRVWYELCFFYLNALNWNFLKKKSHFEKWKTRMGKSTHIQTEHDNNKWEERRIFQQIHWSFLIDHISYTSLIIRKYINSMKIYKNTEHTKQ